MNRRNFYIYFTLILVTLLFYIDNFDNTDSVEVSATNSKLTLDTTKKLFDKEIFYKLSKLGVEERHAQPSREQVQCKTWRPTHFYPTFYAIKKLRRQLWRNDEICSKFEVKRAKKGQLPAVALASYPGSGNTWIRYLIEASTGVFTGSVYEDRHLYFSGFLGELADWSSGETIVQKTHDFGEEWKLFLFFQAKNWLSTIMNWVEFSDELFVIHYELLRKEPVPILRNLTKFLGLTIEEDRFKCIQAYPTGKFMRNKKSDEMEDFPFPESIKNIIDKSIQYADYLLKKSCLPSLPLEDYSHYNNNGIVKRNFRLKSKDKYSDENEFWVSAFYNLMPKIGQIIGIDHLDIIIRNPDVLKDFGVTVDPNFPGHTDLLKSYEVVNKTLLSKIPDDFFKNPAVKFGQKRD
ncbi:sialate:O-sulfotransferase 2-like isoform X2 [Artemia franciscana]|uniref:sialate:O-sulfotransferase 2-like isoform X2 n=1 Tax=Artemia franciscana TaxID=6661 RepID=UPI0032DA2E6A